MYDESTPDVCVVEKCALKDESVMCWRAGKAGRCQNQCMHHTGHPDHVV